MRSLLPPNQTEFETKLEGAYSAWDFIFKEDGKNLIDDLFFSLWSPQKIPAPLLGYLAYGLGVSLWEESWPEQQKRDFISAFLKIRLIQGTTPSITQAAGHLGIIVQIFPTKGNFENRFVIDTTGGVNIPSRDVLKTIRALAEEFSPLRCRFLLETVASYKVNCLYDARLRRVKIKEFSMASDPIVLLTQKGKEAITRALSDSTKIDFDKFVFGTSRYTPAENQTDLKSPAADREEFQVQQARARSDGRGVHVGCIAKSDRAYEVGEIGVKLTNGDLFAIVSRPDTALTVKVDGEELVIGFDIAVENDLQGKISSSNTNGLINLSVADDIANIGTALNNMQKQIETILARLTAVEKP